MNNQFDIEKVVQGEHGSQVESVTDYGRILAAQGIEANIDGPYLVAGSIPECPGWHFHIAIIRQDLPNLIYKLVPLLKELQVPFKIAKDDAAAHQLLSGKWEYQVFAKVVTIYPEAGNDLNIIAQKLISLTSIYKGPVIPTAAYLGGLVFTQYIGNVPFKIENWPFEQSFANPAKGGKMVFESRFRITRVLKSDLKGNVYEARYLRYLLWVSKCVIKEGKKNMWTDNSRRDMRSRLLWQREVLEQLRAVVNVPRVIDLFTDDGNTYLAMEFIQGRSFQDLVDGYYSGRRWGELSLSVRKGLLKYMIAIIGIAQQLHNAGYVHRDITPVNFLVNHKQHIFLIDLELVYSLHKGLPNPPFGNGTFGFMSPEQHARSKPTVHEDVFALGGMLLYVLTGLAPEKFTFNEPVLLMDELRKCGMDTRIAELIASCYQNIPVQRPTTQEINEVVSEYLHRLK